MAILFTGDTHFGHKNILKFCPNSRGQWEDVGEMGWNLIDLWNRSVSESDTVYHLGDFGLGLNPQTLASILRSLNGKKILIQGNHDRKALKNQRFRDAWSEVHEYLDLRVDKLRFILMHYPIESWNGMRRGAIHLHGHSHGGLRHLLPNRLDVGVDGILGPSPVRLEDVVSYLKGVEDNG